jgi:hypothetical protein
VPVYQGSREQLHWINGNSEVVDVEGEWIYPLLKSSDVRSFEIDRTRKSVIVTQRQLGEDTTALQRVAPRLWEYLVKNSEYFERRKSSIYRDRPRFSIFGIGDYSFKPYKVAISGLYKEPRFAVVLPIDDRPVMLDDTCYFLGFDTYLDTLLTASLLNSNLVKQFLQSIVFTDAKRPYTKDALMRINLAWAASRISLSDFHHQWAKLGYEPRITVNTSDLEAYKRRLLITNRDNPQLSLEM